MTNETLERKEVDIGLLDPNPNNPNEMTEKQFNLLYDNMERVGFTDPILVRPHPEHEGRYRIIGGEHRWEVAKVMGYEQVPVTVITDPGLTDDDEAFQLVRHNVIKGQLSPKRFLDLYNSLSEDYSEEVAAEMFGFADEEEFKRLIQSTKKSLPPEMQQDFEAASKEIKTIDDLSKVLNELFATYGDTLPHAYMIVDFGGKESVWLRMEPKMKKAFLDLGQQCRKRQKSMDHVMNRLVQMCAQDGPVELDIDKLIDECPTIEMDEDSDQPPTLDFLDEQL